MRHEKHSSYHRYKSWQERKQCGYKKNLFRNSRDGKIAGVCAGLADHLGVDHWVVRVVFVAFLIMGGPIVFWAYIIAWIAIAKRPLKWQPDFEYDEDRHQYRERSVFRNSKPAAERLRTARSRMDSVSARVETLERYVTSSRYNLDKEFEEMERGST
ncbi:envelope stress response membrane protein PspC [Teredinibacter sp. KSP-S5-2]|uniref:envelope stress response membrane protein PspC n=1 Tax=Teredinibacter sp. KSP-S5-2 TaxID=3034506 RepID=UPI0029351065|nr:envelope stress response membrane protein PspC [Teredinibacter sp. KSP-S5-2]WNO09332.1 envelope stress response membrane protein PspC [Teredinibacter sp. KSP-S5-2]